MNIISTKINAAKINYFRVVKKIKDFSDPRNLIPAKFLNTDEPRN